MKILYEANLNDKQVLRISVAKYNGRPSVSIRKWYRSENGEVRPTRQGVAITDLDILSDVALAFQDVVQQILSGEIEC
jgi:hypothetical protein